MNASGTTRIAQQVVDGLDAARRQSSVDRPVDEVALIAAAIDDATEIYRVALRKIANSDKYQGGGCGTKLGRAMDIARKALKE